MEDIKKKVQKQISDGKPERALKTLIDYASSHAPDLGNPLISLQAGLKDAKRKYNMGVLTEAEWQQKFAKTSAALLDMLGELDNPGPQGGQTSKSVFISYNHKDAATANKIREALESEGLKIIMDTRHMQAGANISEFIEQSVVGSDVTLSLVSNHSLLSGWVAMETINTFYLSKFNPNKKFIACYLEADFFDPAFRLKATRTIDEKIREYDKLMEEYRKERLDTVDIDADRSRLHELRGNLGKILNHLKNSLCLDVSQGQFDASMRKLVEAIKAS